jgi:hypothetical protein
MWFIFVYLEQHRYGLNVENTFAHEWVWWGEENLALRMSEEGKNAKRGRGIESLDVGAKGEAPIEEEAFPLLRWTLAPIACSRHLAEELRRFAGESVARNRVEFTIGFPDAITTRVFLMIASPSALQPSCCLPSRPFLVLPP